MNDPLRELDHRTDGRTDVWLLWRERDDRLFVAVANENTFERFRIEVRDDERPLDVFLHPYEHAARRGIDTRSESSDVTAWVA